MSPNHRPEYFEPIRQKSSMRWDQLEADPELAGPWKQLFNQVQSPKHVISELLQNADDAGATSVVIDLNDRLLEFSHNGDDFREEHFGSLCRFAYSNKRSLHTIGFRGIGFKSTFSLGEIVYLETPTLSVCFNRCRFTEPIWVDRIDGICNTRICVNIEDANRESELRVSLTSWLASPFSLLFFKNIRKLELLGRAISVDHLSNGPVPNSEVVRLNVDNGPPALDGDLLLCRSQPESLPDDCIHEIRQERGDPTLELPPIEVSIVLGCLSKNRLYVVLPTGVEIDYPFSVNAPFLQDPARFGIKDPSISPTNRWLLRKTGELAATTMLDWLNNADLTIAKRSRAYDLFPRLDRLLVENSKSAGNVAENLWRAFRETVVQQSFLLDSTGQLRSKEECFGVPVELHDIWSDEQIAQFFRKPNWSLLAPCVTQTVRESLACGRFIDLETKASITNRLERVRPPRPNRMDKIALLWRFINTSFHYDFRGVKRRQVNFVPIQNNNLLGKAADIVRLSSARLSEGDIRFLSEHLNLVDQEWEEFVTSSSQHGNTSDRDDTRKIANDLGLFAVSQSEKIIELALKSIQLMNGSQGHSEKIVRLTHIAAAMNAQVPENYLFLTQANELQPASIGLICPIDKSAHVPTPEEWRCQHTLSDLYFDDFPSCSKADWYEWLCSPASRISTSLPILPKELRLSKLEFANLLNSRGGSKPATYPYKASEVVVTDFDLPSEISEVYEADSREAPEIWSGFLVALLKGPPHVWINSISISAKQDGLSISKSVTLDEPVASEWILRLRSYKCIPDTHGQIAVPSSLYMRTPETEPFMGVSAFVRADLDKEQNKPLLRLLGVKEHANSVWQVLDQIRKHAHNSDPESHLAELARWFDVLDRQVGTANQSDVDELRRVFEDEPLLLSSLNSWHTSSEIYQQSNDDSHLFAVTLHQALRGKMLWGLLGVQSRPSANSSLEWLKDLKNGDKLDSKQTSIARGILRNYSGSVWQSCRSWLSLAGTWVDVDKLRFRISMQELGKYSKLYLSIRASTADFRMLNSETINASPFNGLQDLKAVTSIRLVESSRKLARLVPDVPWLRSIAAILQRLKFPDEKQLEIRAAAYRLAQSKWYEVADLRIQPWIDGKLAGEPSEAHAIWEESAIYVCGNQSKWFEVLSDEITSIFPDVEHLRQTIRDCIDRTPHWIENFLVGHYGLDPTSKVLGTLVNPKPESDSSQPGMAPSRDSVKDRSNMEQTNDVKQGISISGESRERIKLNSSELPREDQQKNPHHPSSEPPQSSSSHYGQIGSNISPSSSSVATPPDSSPDVNRTKLRQAHSRESERRRAKLRERISRAPVRESVQRFRAVSNLARTELDREGLRQYYRDEEDRLFCQMCCETMPFLKRDGVEFSEFVSIFRMDWAQKLGITLREFAPLNLILCPICSRIYEEYVHRSERLQTLVYNQFLDLKQVREIAIPCSIENSNESDRVITFDPTHIADVRVYFETTSLR